MYKFPPSFFMEKAVLSRYLIDKKEQIRKFEVFPRLLEVARTKRFIIPIVGPRRAGKSFYLYDLILNKLKIADTDFVYLNFEDPELTGANFRDVLSAIDSHEELHGKKPQYVFLDEIQNIQDWEKAVRGLYETRAYHIFLSGSSSKLLSKEITTSLRGRTLTYSILPLSFREYLGFKKFEIKPFYSTSEENRIKNSLREYLKFGGFPDIVFEKQIVDKFFREYLDLIIFRDIIERHKIKNIFVIKFLVKSLLVSFSKQFSIHNVFNTLKSQGIKVSKKTLYNYSSHLEDAFFAFFLKKFSYSAKDAELSIPKVFVNDSGLVNSVILNFSEKFGRLMENSVFLELKRAQNECPSLEISYYKNGGEVDFVVKKGLEIVQLIQVCHDIAESKTKDRELNALVRAGTNLKCRNLLVITWDCAGEEKFRGKKITYKPLWEWLLTKDRHLY